MNRDRYFDYISDKLHILSRKIESNGKLNLLDIHGHSENFYLHFFNLLYGYKLENLNSKLHNVPAIDLIDKSNKIFIQVSATATKQKIESSLSKEMLKIYNGYTFNFISISKDATSLRKSSFKNPHLIKFVPETDIHDITSILNIISSKNIDELKAIYEFIKKELGSEIDVVKLDSNLAIIINILSKQQWDENDQSITINSFEIERKIKFNDLNNKSNTIREYCLYQPRVDQKYAEFDTMGVNKSKSVLASINRLYLNNKNKGDADTILSSVIDGIREIVLNSNNYENIPIDELDLCIDILVVDAFVRCKIFENPEGYTYVAAR